jgi:hypothetical protein
MTDQGQDMLAFLGVAADARLLEADLGQLPASERRSELSVPDERHARLVVAGSAMTGASLLGGLALLGYGGEQLLFAGGGVAAAVAGAIGLLLVATHWGWVHVAEYAGLTIDARHAREVDARRNAWLAAIEPYPRFSVVTSVGDDGAMHVQRLLHRPVRTDRDTFTFTCSRDLEHVHAVDAPVDVVAGDVEALRHQASLLTERMRQRWEAAATSYAAALLDSGDDEREAAAHRAAAIALSEHINASLLDAPLVE